MSALSDLQKVCLASLLVEDEDKARLRMQELLVKCQDRHFHGDYFRLWRVIARYYPILDAVPPVESLREIITNSKELNVLTKDELLKNLDELVAEDISDILFQISVRRLGEYWQENEFQEMLAVASDILNGSVTIKNDVFAGYEDARAYISDHLNDLDSDLHVPTQEGDINAEVADVLRRYVSAKNGENQGILTGLADLDDVTGGLRPGDLMLIGGYTSEGKSKLSLNMAYSACYEQCKNVVYGVNETTREQVQLGMTVRHSHNARFGGATPLRYSAVDRGKLTADGEDMLKQVLLDMRTDRDEDDNRRHGHMEVFQMPSRVSLDYVRHVILKRQRSYPVDLVVVDYLGLMSSGRRESRREELDDLLVQAKRMAVELQVPIISPWQISRVAWEAAQHTGAYTKSALGETAQTERASDILLTILAMEEQNKLKCQILKNRNGEAGAEFELFTNWASSYVSSDNALDRILSF